LEEAGPTLVGLIDSDSERSGGLCLLVIGDGVVTTYPLPAEGGFTVGRAQTNDVRIDEASISREHVRIVLGEMITVEDLGSANGTKLGNTTLEAHRPTVISPGQAIEIGSSMLILQRSGAARSTRRLWPHGYFEAHLEDQCALCRKQGGRFGVIRVRVEGRGDPRWIRDTLTSILGPRDLVANYAPAEYALLLLDLEPSKVDAIAEDLVSALHSRGVVARAGVACWSRDGRSHDELVARAGAALRARADDRGSQPIVEDAAMIDLYRVAGRVARGTIGVLLLGETGVGKEVLALAIHEMSPRRDGPYLSLNCAALSESILESELFGHQKGAFTGASGDKKGLLEAASGGTVFLDEVGEMPASIQAKLLRVIEERRVRPVGALEHRAIDVRFIAATNRNLEEDIETGAFRRDLYFRLNGVTLVIPPLRERVAEIEPLAKVFLRKICSEMDLAAVEISPSALDLLRSYAWPGNIRELRNVIERAVLLCPDDQIEKEHLPLDKMSASWGSSAAAPRRAGQIAESETAAPDGLPDPTEFERQRILEALRRAGGNQTRAAELLGVSRRTLSTWLNKHAIDRPRKGR